MTVVDLGQFGFEKDPDSLLVALYRLPRERVAGVEGAVFGLIAHSDPDVREEALRVLLTHWKCTTYRESAIRLLATDDAETVRSAAAFAVAATATPASTASDTDLLLSVLRNASEHSEVRASAYDALVILHRKGAGLGLWPFPDIEQGFDPDRDVDWTWIDRIERGGG